jgi:hypothetical protein
MQESFMDTDSVRAAFLWTILVVAIVSIVAFRVVVDRKVKRASAVRAREKAEQAQKNWDNIPNTTTEAQERTRIAMEQALRNTQQQAPPAAPPSLSTRLTQLDDALHAGLITQQDYAQKRAEIIASA